MINLTGQVLVFVGLLLIFIGVILIEVENALNSSRRRAERLSNSRLRREKNLPPWRKKAEPISKLRIAGWALLITGVILVVVVAIT